MIETTNITKRYGRVTALEDVSIRVQSGSFTAVLGPSGSGKSTLFRIVLGLTEPDSGIVTVDGRRMNGNRSQLKRTRPLIAPVFQGFHLVPRLSALTNVLIGRLPFSAGWGTLFHRFSKEDRKWAEHCLERVGLAHKKHQRADTLSGGERQRVAVARGLAQRAKIFYADEPISSLDPKLGVQILDLLRHINSEEHVTLVCNLHQVELARDYAEDIIGLQQGKVRFHSLTQDISSSDIAELYS